jgi:hypothetical protein
MSVDLFGSPTVVGIKVKLDRDIDRENPCHDNVAVIHPGKAQHAGELRCAHCDRYRGWLPQSTCNFISRNGSAVRRAARADHRAPTSTGEQSGFSAET